MPGAHEKNLKSCIEKVKKSGKPQDAAEGICGAQIYGPKGKKKKAKAKGKKK